VLCLLAPSARAAELCPALPPPTGNVVDVTPAQAGQLAAIVAGARSGDTIRLADGTYALDGDVLLFATPGVTLRSASGDRDAVVLDGNYQGGNLVAIVASNVTVADLTLRRSWHHLVHVTPQSAHVTGTLLHNLRAIDPGEQAIKVNANGAQTLFADDGVIRCSRIELTDAGRPHIRNGCYTGGIDAHRARGWHVHDNEVAGFWCASGLSEHGIHFWTGSRDTLVERNRVRDCARGIGFGLGQGTPGRAYADAPCGGAANLGHYGGTIRNNIVFAGDDRLFDQGAGGFDLGIGLEEACGTRVLHNTVVSTRAPFSSIEGRFANTAAVLTNNLMSHNLRARDGAVLTLAGNLASAPGSLFVEAAVAGDLHLVDTALAAIDQGAAVPAGHADRDLDGEVRETARDVGADEHRPDHVFADDFQSGALAAWSAANTAGGDLAVAADAGMGGTTLGLRATVDDTAGRFVEDATPSAEKRYRARFYLDADGFDPGVADGHLRTRVFIAFQGAPARRRVAIVLRLLGGQHALMARVRRDDGTLADTGFVPVAPGQPVELDWVAASAPGASDGTFQMWIGGVLAAGLDGLDTGGGGIDFARLGALSLKTGASGTLAFDEFVSRRKTYIGSDGVRSAVYGLGRERGPRP
jgi:hypothetical protein